jgi:hypothetical protein
VEIRTATDDDWPGIYRFYSIIMAEGRTYPFPDITVAVSQSVTALQLSVALDARASVT